MQFPRWSSDGILHANHYDPSRPPPLHEQSQIQNDSQQSHSNFTPFVFNIKEEHRDSYGVPEMYGGQQVESDYRLEQYSRVERPGMVLSHPIPDYSVASGSSPFTRQLAAPHFQPRPRPIMSSDPRQDFDYQQQRQDERAMAYHHPSWDYPPPQESNMMRGNGEPRLQDILPQPAECGPLSNHLTYSTSHNDQHDYQNSGVNGHPLEQQEPHHVHQEQQPELQNLSADEANADPTKKIRKRRRLKGELPRDHALRKYKCTECEQKFARPSALATHVLTHTKEKPFVCATCQRGFAVMSNLRRHCRVRKHETSPASSPPSRAATVPISNEGSTWQ